MTVAAGREQDTGVANGRLNNNHLPSAQLIRICEQL